MQRGGLSNQKIKKGTFVRVAKLSFLQRPVKIRDVVGPPSVYSIDTFVFSTPALKKSAAASKNILGGWKRLCLVDDRTL